MDKGKKSKCTSGSHHQLIDNAKNRLNDIQQRFFVLQAARRDGRVNDAAFLEEQMYQCLCQWKAELDAPSPSSSLVGQSLGFFSEDIERLLQLRDEEDDAISPLAKQSAVNPESKPDPDLQSLTIDDYLVNGDNCGHSFQGFDQSGACFSGLEDNVVSIPGTSAKLDCHQVILDEGFSHEFSFGIPDAKECVNDAETNELHYGDAELHYGDAETNKVHYGDAGEYLSNAGTNEPYYISPPPSAFMGPKCALWDCSRPAQGSEWCWDYCCSFHACLALNEGLPGMNPVLRPNGIGLKDNLLLNALTAKTQGKNVGIPPCEGAASTKSPWNATELFDLSLLESETIREWLFFDKPRRAFDSGNRKQRSLPDYSGRGWHESRKQAMKELGGQKRSYYMDPQPPGGFEWHLFEYEVNNYDTCALYRLEVKVVDGKKSPKGKVSKESLADLQKKMGMLTAENSPPTKGRTKAKKNARAGDAKGAQDQINPSAGSPGHGTPSESPAK